jgi:hypothetical protein
MEHRWSVRKRHQCRVVVDCPRVGPAVAELRNIGIGGMFVESGKLDLPLNAPVSVAFTLGHDGYREDFRLPAMVVRRMPNGAGIMFLESEVETLRALRRALYESQSLISAQTASNGRRGVSEWAPTSSLRAVNE